MKNAIFVSNTRHANGFNTAPASLASIEAQVVTDASLSETAFRIRYRAYRSYGYIGMRDSGMFHDEYDERPNFRTVVVFKDNVPAATVRVSLSDAGRFRPEENRLQAMEIFGHEIEAATGTLGIADHSPRIMEIAKLARAPEFANDIDVVFALYRAAGYFILHYDADIVFNAVRRHHLPMYRRFGFEQLTELRAYPGLDFETALMACFKSRFGEARTSLPFLRGLSKGNPAYGGLMAGERVSLATSPARALAAFPVQANSPGTVALPFPVSSAGNAAHLPA